MYKTLIGSSGVEPMPVPKIENTFYSHCVHKSKGKVQTPVKNSWSDLGIKAGSSQRGFHSTSSRTAFRKGKKVKKNRVKH